MSGNTITYPRCRFPLAEMADAERALDRRLKLRKPFSMIRLGDGEGVVLGRPPTSDETLWAWARRVLGPQITPATLGQLADQLQEAIETADMIGIRDDIVDVHFPATRFDLPEDQFLDRFGSAFHLRPAERRKGYASALRIARTHRVLGRYRFPRAARFCSAWLHFNLSSSGALARYLFEEKCPALVSGRSDLGAELPRALGKAVDFYELPADYPSEAGHRPEQTHDLAAYVEAFQRTRDLIEVKYPGQLFLVGGGIWSKAICGKIKHLGGIALDVGAVCDAWLGIPSRPVVYRSMFDTGAGTVPEGLKLSVQMRKIADHG